MLHDNPVLFEILPANRNPWSDWSYGESVTVEGEDMGPHGTCGEVRAYRLWIGVVAVLDLVHVEPRRLCDGGADYEPAVFEARDLLRRFEIDCEVICGLQHVCRVDQIETLKNRGWRLRHDEASLAMLHEPHLDASAIRAVAFLEPTVVWSDNARITEAAGDIRRCNAPDQILPKARAALELARRSFGYWAESLVLRALSERLDIDEDSARALVAE